MATQWQIRQGLWLALISLVLVLTTTGTASADQTLTPSTGLSALASPALMPAFSLPSPDGTRVDSATFQGQVVVVRFWATW